MASVRRIAFLLLVALSACTIASDFKEPITQFSTATTQAETALKEFDKGAAKQLPAVRHADAMKTPVCRALSAVIGSWSTGPRGSQMVTYPV